MKKVFCMMLAAAMLLSLAACGKKDDMIRSSFRAFLYQSNLSQSLFQIGDQIGFIF